MLLRDEELLKSKHVKKQQGKGWLPSPCDLRPCSLPHSAQFPEDRAGRS